MIRTLDMENAKGERASSTVGPLVDPLGFSRRLIQALVGLNWLMGAGIATLLVASFIADQWMMRALGMHPAASHSTLLLAARLIMLVGIASTPFTHVVLTRLGGIVDTVGHGTPFMTENAVRMRSVAWAAVGLEVLHLAVGLITHTVPSPGETLDLNWSFSITRWLYVLLLFVLARVFESGAAMREDVEGTV